MRVMPALAWASQQAGSAAMAYLKNNNAPSKLPFAFSIFASFNGQIASLGSFAAAIYNY